MMLVAPRRPAYRLLLIYLALCGANAHALGLGSIVLQSGLGRPLQARIPVYGLAADDTGASCLKTRLLALDGSLLARPLAELSGSGAAAVLNLRTVVSVNEPVVSVSVEMGCATSVKREYQILLDPVPATAPHLASVAPAARPGRAERGTAAPMATVGLQDPVAPTTAAAPAGAPAKRPAATRPKPAALKSVLTLSTGDAEIEQVRASLALRYATTLSTPRLETDPARLAELHADQARVAALLRGENPLDAARTQNRALQARLQAAQQTATNAARRVEQADAAMAAMQDQTVSSRIVGVLVALLLACLAAIGWLLWRRADDRRRQAEAFFSMDTAPAGPFAPGSPAAPAADAAPVSEPAPDFPVVQFSDAPVETSQPAAAVHDWGSDPLSLPVATSAPEQIDIPDSWLLVQNSVEEVREVAVENAWITPPGKAQAHAADVSSLLLAAEDWMAEHSPLRAAELLRPYLERDDIRSPAPGLYLLSLYRTMDDQAQIRHVEAHLKQYFPAQAADWRDTTQPRRSIADFPAVYAVVDSLSGTDELLPYLHSLLLAPEQFDFSTYRDIVRAIRVTSELKQQSEMHAMSLDFQ